MPKKIESKEWWLYFLISVCDLYAICVSLYEITGCKNLYDVIMNCADKQAGFKKQ